MKLLLLGIDGATFDLIQPWLEAGHLPNLAKLVNNGTSGPLRSTLPPVTSPAWPTFMTGCNPGKHGVFDFIQPTGTDFSLVNASKLKQSTIWELFSAENYKVGVLNVPVTYPPKAVNGFIVSGILSPKNGDICHPPNLISRYKAELGNYRVAPNVQYKPGNEAEFIADLYDLIDVHGRWAVHLLKHEPVDVMMVHFIALDLMMHALWRYMDHAHPRFAPSAFEHAIRDGHKRVDRYIGEMLALIPPETHVIAMSDHGFGPLHRIVNLNNFLLQKGFLKLRRHPLTQLKAFAFRCGISPAAIYRMLAKLGLQNIATRVSKNTRNQVLGKFLNYSDVDWQRTTAYSMGHVGQIYLNLVGREPHGTVGSADYEQTRQAVADALSHLQDETGRSLVDEVIFGQHVYDGDYASQGPDIHLVIDGYNMIAFPLFATNGDIITEQIRGDSGCHRRDGILIVNGPLVKQHGSVEDADIVDIAPTLFALLNEPVPNHMDGRVLTDVFSTVPTVTYADYADTDSAETDEDAALIEQRLRDLGYLT